MIYLVRHAHAGTKHGWPGPDRLRPLSDEGYREARGLITRLAGVHVAAIASSPSVRCVQTVAELARLRGMPVRTERLLAADTGLDDALRFVLDATDTVLCSHGELIGRLLAGLRERGAPIPVGAEWAKGSTWRLAVSRGRVTHAMYLRPLQVAPYETQIPA
jgi:8-oxo-dGTP diphosphatase